ncbi:MAG: putative cytochrome c1 precursor protein [Proteobacteria bacterium]|nr:putative cytochrome c1 precursor protein [Pseudomonadota bacterium]
MNIMAVFRRTILRQSGLRKLAVLAGAGVVLSLSIQSANALPSYARQTGSECASCHVGGFGPQLTPYGIRFKINGYTDSDGKEGKIPLSAMMVVNSTHTAKDVPDGDKVNHFNNNNNTAMQEASVFLAGRLTDNIGSFVQVTYSGVDRTYALDQADIRYARSVKLGDKDMTVGVSLNTNPTLTDPFNTLGQWRFPYTSSDFNAGFGPAAPKVESLGGGVMGVNAYAFYDDSIYAELGLYNNLSKKALNAFNTEDQGKFKGVGTYGRLAYFKDRKRDNFSVGLLGFSADIQPDRAVLGVADKYRDVGIDASYQYLGNRQHIFTANASYVREWQRLNYTMLGADDVHNTIDQFRAAGSYHYDQTWGGTVGVFDLRGKTNTSLNSTIDEGTGLVTNGSISGRPNTSGYILQADWTPWGKEGSWGGGWANVRVGVQYTGYIRFMGGSTYLDSEGNERRARDNNTTMLFLWTSI